MNKLFVICDYQNDFVTGSMGFEGAKLIDEKIAEKVELYRSEGADIVYTMDTHGPQYHDMQEGKKNPTVHCQNGTDGWKLYGKTGEVCKDAMTIGKHTFGSMDLAELALFKGYDVIEISGISVNTAVIANAILLKTTQPEAEIIIDVNCVSSKDEKLKNATLDVLESLQFTILNK